MGKSKRNKKEQAQLEFAAFNDCAQVMALAAAAIVLTDEELTKIFENQEKRLHNMKFDTHTIEVTLANLADTFTAFRGETNDTSRETEKLRSN